MNSSSLLPLFDLFLNSSNAAAQPTPSEDLQQKVSLALQPSLAIVIGIFFIVFSLTFLFIVYAKFCHTLSRPFNINGENELHQIFNRSLRPPFPGLNKKAIESLPSIRFSSLKGPREGLECAICLSKFEDAEILRFLPKCKHAFHIGCIDQWLEMQSCCPLCRCKVEAEDATLFKFSTTSRSLFSSRDLLEEGDIFVERVSREPDTFSFLPKGRDGYHKYKHRIILSDILFKKRWSDLQSSGFVTDEESGGIIRNLSERSMSEINSSSFVFEMNRERIIGGDSRDEKLRRLWIPIMRRTMESIGDRKVVELVEERRRESVV